jgi:hypothetical protein
MNILQTQPPLKPVKVKDIAAKYPKGEGEGAEEETQQTSRKRNTNNSPQKNHKPPQKHHKMHPPRRMVQSQFDQKPLHFGPMRFTIEE